jgi:lipoate-protein ligase B
MALFRYLPLRSTPNIPLPQFPSYAFASHVQTALQRELLTWKARSPSDRGPPPPPSVICFTPTPTYTLGRRQTEPLSESEIARLQSPLFLPSLSLSGSKGRAADDDKHEQHEQHEHEQHGQHKQHEQHEQHEQGKAVFFLPTVTHAPRGGLATYHGPGQLVIWPVIDLHSPLHAHLSVRDYACLLEKTTIATLERLWRIAGFTTDNPGVWVRPSGSQREGGGDERKIAALGVHLRRHVTGLGVAINYSTPISGPPETNPWDRIVACGLGDRGVTSVSAELGLSNPGDEESALERLGDTWRSEFQKRLKMNERSDSQDRFDMNRSMKDFGAQIKGRVDFLVKAQPISSLQA